jgi:hypothetical protein
MTVCEQNSPIDHAESNASRGCGIVTAAMLSEGHRVLSEHYLGDGVYDLRDEVLAKLYQAMHSTR